MKDDLGGVYRGVLECNKSFVKINTMKDLVRQPFSVMRHEGSARQV